MCGIVGFCNFNENFLYNKEKYDNTLKNMQKSVSRRGGDAYGYYISENIALGHSRLSIRDLSESGNQPITRKVYNNEYTIIYNGEIYNTSELKDDLIEKGYIFSTNTDTEVILYLFIEYRERCVSLLNGIFSFCIYDKGEKSIYLFRDRLGVKPLFYTICNNTLVFASEKKALFEHFLIEPKITDDSLREIFGLGPARLCGSGVFKGIHEVKYGHILIFNKYGSKEKRYWDIENKEHTDNYAQTVEKVSFLVRDAIERQLVSDVPICSFLSGGIDSSIVTAVSSNYLNSLGKKLNTFSFDFKENDIYFKSNDFQPERDKPYIDIMLKNYNLNHKYLECDDSILVNLLYNAVDAKDLPGMADIDASMLYFCSLVKNHNKVSLTGECADEIFGGYPWFYKDELLDLDIFPWSKNLDIREFFLTDSLKKRLNLKDYVIDTYKSSIKNMPYADYKNKKERKRKEVAYLNIKWFMPTLLDRMDRMSMYNGLEARVPFADHRIVDYVWNVPWDMKYRNGIEKSLLRDATKDLLPKELLNRKKSPYPKTYNPKYEKLLKEELLTIINNNSSPINSIINKKTVENFISSTSDYGKAWFGQLMAGPQMMAYLIQINYWLKKYNLSI